MMKTLMTNLAITLICFAALAASAQTTEFNYQGKLTDTGTPSATYDFEFRLFNVASGGTALATQQKAAVPVTNYVFNVSLDFGASVFDGTNRWLEIAVKRPNQATYTTLSPRQQITSVPYSVKTKTADLAADSNKLGGVNASEYVTTSTVGGSFIKNDTVQQTANFNISGNGIVGGRIGIGTNAPVAGFDMRGTGIGTQQRITDTTSGNSLVFQAGAGSNMKVTGYNYTTAMAVPLYLGVDGANTIINPNGGNVGIGTTNPSLLTGSSSRILAVTGSFSPGVAITNVGTGGNQYFIYSGANGSPNTGHFKIYDATHSLDRFTIANNGFVGIGTNNPTQQLDVAGTTKTSVLQISGGSDLAENFEIGGENIKPGMVVAIDPNNPGKLVIASGAYSRQVAGIVSGANNLSAGMLLPDLKENENSLPIALSGRVWVYADATKNPVKPGDLLTTSDTPGYAMKVTKHKKANGAIIGKAMTELKSGTGLVLVLVSLQ